MASYMLAHHVHRIELAEMCKTLERFTYQSEFRLIEIVRLD